MKLDLACGQNCQPGFMGVDLWPDADITCDLTVFPWQWRDGTVDEVFCSHYVEHVVDLIGFMNEVWRIMKPDGLVTIVHPYGWSNRAWQDPTHVRALVEQSWYYYNEDARKAMGVDHYPIVANFDIVDVAFLHGEQKSITFNDVLHKLNVVDDLRITLRTIK